MRLALARPPGNNIFRWKSPPLGLLSIAGYLKQGPLSQAVEIRLFDFFPGERDITRVVSDLAAFRPDILGISFLTAQAEQAYQLCRVLRSVCSTLTVAGGVHPTVRPDEALEAGFDRVVVGEGESAMARIVKTHLAGSTSPSRSILRGEPQMDGSSIPTPAWELLDLSLAYNDNIDLPGQIALPIMASRGCAFDCSFCASKAMWQQKLRTRDPGAVAAELAALVEEYGISGFRFYDDDFLVSKRFALDLISAVQSLAVPIHWTALATVRSICRNRDLLPLMKEAGCRGFSVGIETADPEVLRIINKRQQTEDSAEALRLLISNGFEYIEPLLMYFNEAETVESIAAESEFFNALGLPCPALDLHQYATPFPGTRFHTTCRETGELYTRSWTDYRTDRINYIPVSFLSSKFPVIEPNWPEALPAAIEREAVTSTHSTSTVVSEIWRTILLERLTGTVSEVAAVCTERLGFQLHVSVEEVVKTVALFAIVGTRISHSRRGTFAQEASHVLTEHRRAPAC